MSDGYADLLRDLLPGAVVDICYPADPGANLPIGGLEGYDGVAITGSALNVYDGGPQIEPQIELARAVLQAQDAAVRQLLGPAGDHRRGRRQRAARIRRAARSASGARIALTAAGREHPMYAGKATVFDAVTVHLDEVETLAPGTHGAGGQRACPTCRRPRSASTARSPGACNIIPEFTLGDMAAIMRRYGTRLVERRLLRRRGGARRLCRPISTTLDRDPDNKPLAWRYGIDETVLDQRVRTDRDRQLDHASGAADAREARTRIAWIFAIVMWW